MKHLRRYVIGVLLGIGVAVMCLFEFAADGLRPVKPPCPEAPVFGPIHYYPTDIPR